MSLAGFCWHQTFQKSRLTASLRFAVPRDFEALRCFLRVRGVSRQCVAILRVDAAGPKDSACGIGTAGCMSESPRTRGPASFSGIQPRASAGSRAGTSATASTRSAYRRRHSLAVPASGHRVAGAALEHRDREEGADDGVVHVQAPAFVVPRVHVPEERADDPPCVLDELREIGYRLRDVGLPRRWDAGPVLRVATGLDAREDFARGSLAPLPFTPEPFGLPQFWNIWPATGLVSACGPATLNTENARRMRPGDIF